jgi:glutamyl-Q tRNA(Asp) synthetase
MMVTRFAPSPTGFLHLGHAASALTGWRAAREANGRFLLRIEDIDRTRCRPAFEEAIHEDLAWLGLDWEQPVRRQSEHRAEYAAAIATLESLSVLYPCFCTRKDILAEIAAAGEAPQGPEGPLYPGLCRALEPAERRRRIGAGAVPALRLDAERAAGIVGELSWNEQGQALVTVDPRRFGDGVIVRRDIGASYHLAVVVDDAAQGVTLVTRGADLAEATHIHRVLQALLGLKAPDYRHHPLVRDDQGRRLAKRDGARGIRAMRDAGMTPAEVRALAGFSD